MTATPPGNSCNCSTQSPPWKAFFFFEFTCNNFGNVFVLSWKWPFLHTQHRDRDTERPKDEGKLAGDNPLPNDYQG